MKNRSLACKVLLLFCISNFVVKNAFSQLELSSANTTGNHTAPISIVLKPGFSTASGQSFHAYITAGCTPLAAAPSNNQNYIVTYTPRVAGVINPADPANSSCDVMASVQYFDGLGRPLQNVQVKGSPSLKDIIEPIAYDAFGRENIKYLPYTTSQGTSGTYRPDALNPMPGNPVSAQQAFYNRNGENYTPIKMPFSELLFEASPLNRLLEKGSPGDAWQLTGKSGAVDPGHTVKTEYSTNDADASSGNGRFVKLYDVVYDSNGKPSLSDRGLYQPNQLYVTIAKDENWKASDGKIGTVEQYTDKQGQIILKRTFNTGGEVLSTYYVYDDFGNLTFILSPKAQPDNGGITPTQLDLLCFQYRFDGRNRVVEKKLPGVGRQYLVYNKLDNIVATQDSMQRVNNLWSVFKYDAFERPVISGNWNNNNSPVSRMSLQSQVDGSSVLWEQRDNNNSGNYYYTSQSFPISGITRYLSVNYYDAYNIPNLPTAYNATSLYTSNTTTLVTASLTNVVNTNDMLWSVQYYDDNARIVKTYLQHYLNGAINEANYDEITNTYSFTNEVLTTNRIHHALANPTLNVANTFEYDHVGRKINSWEAINGGTPVLLSKIEFNEVGQLYKKHLYSKNNGSSFLQDVLFKYNERGWLNKDSSGLFVMQLKYNDSTNPQFNGNIANQFWGTGSSLNKSYTYSYDKLSRLTDGVSNEGFNEYGITYDLAGNILTLKRDNPASTVINLGYNYNGNQLSTITGISANNYLYDGNGNVKYDPHTNINISYNQLNLPQNITGSKSINYFYDASGNKLRTVSANSTFGSTDYINGLQYKDGIIQTISTQDGLARRKSDGTFSYEFYLQDHLGNTRLSFDDSSGVARVVQRDDYYPFGMEINRKLFGSKNQNLFNGKELMDEIGLVDFGARLYDPYIGRWNMIDQMAEKYASLSPYNFAANNPIKRMDPDGRDVIFTITRDKDGNITDVKISSTVYISGDGASDKRANELTKYSASQLKAKTVNGVNVSFDVQYKYDNSKKESDLGAGENMMVFHSGKDFKDGNRSHVDPNKTDELRTGRVGHVYSSGANNRTVFHETLHEMGLSDRYDETRVTTFDEKKGYGTAVVGVNHPGFPNDIMSSGMNFDKHYYNYFFNAAKSAYEGYVLSPFVTQTNTNYISGAQVSNIPYSQYVDKIRSGILTPYEGKPTHTLGPDNYKPGALK
ncbi:RHS repeat-associated core domain-containing protein [Mucilaginibacter sp. ZT4R22]|uniref:RHS repeat-associated core domain-containing protein n=1 Tax=Mucilaginibacter pankratovii TaxID=2772110 RepID=A0ABR7WQF9_9SPHI|nr:DUF6443 domain-containing protein [Mucilaginibacter pankratovii]MBD1364559.1 RHS repeat-associated core domain-containing protein [Mucilaginibacter pankratovii]